MPGIDTRLNSLREEIAALEQDNRRAIGSTCLVAVSKNHGSDAVEAAQSAGQRVFGENRVQEALGKFRDLKADGGDVELHLIGPLQSNKVKDAVGLFDVIQSVDREKLIVAIANSSQKLGRSPRLFLQVNTGEEPQKAGVLPKDLEDLLSFAAAESLNIEGLMAIPPADEPAAPHFAFLKKRCDELGLPSASMGMSGDYPHAIALGATHIRVGTAIFGARDYT